MYKGSHSPGASSTPSLHLDDIQEQLSSSDERECAVAHLACVKDSFPQKTRKHIKLFKQYVSTCEQVGVKCSLDSETSSETSEILDDSISEHPSQTTDLQDQCQIKDKLRSFIAKHHSWSCNRPISFEYGGLNGIKGTSDFPSRVVSTPSTSIAWRSAGSCPVLLDSRYNVNQDWDAVYRRQVASALRDGRSVWL
jgi:hypothetical protein